MRIKSFSIVFFLNSSLHACGGESNVCFLLRKNPIPHWSHLTEMQLLEPRLMGATTVSNEGVVYFR